MKLPEDAIGEKLGVSRTLVREALVRLAIEGLVEIKTNRGARVAYPTWRKRATFSTCVVGWSDRWRTCWLAA